MIVLTTMSLTGCIYNGYAPGKTSTPEATVKPSEKATPNPTITPVPTATNKLLPLPTTGTPNTESPNTDVPATTAPATGTLPDNIKDAVKGETSTKEKPIPNGQWVIVNQYSGKDEAYHPVYARVKKVTTSSSDAKYVEDAIALHNKFASDYGKVDVSTMKLPKDVEICVVEYEVYVPDTFPAADYGLSRPELHLYAKNITGGGIPSADGTARYIGLGGAYNLQTEEYPDYNVGNTYSFRSYFTMVKGFTDYVFECSYFPEGKGDSDLLYAYFDNK